MAISVKLEAFSGPLDLLLHLIDKNKIDIYDIPIAEITDQYLEYVRSLDKEDMDTASEFMIMAATLLDIKCRMLLPKEETDEEEGDPRDELVRRLLEYKKYKYMSKVLREQLEDAGVVVERKQLLPKEVLQYKPEVDMDELLEGISLDSLYKVFNEVIKRQETKIDPVRSTFGKIEKEKISFPESMLKLEKHIIKKRKVGFKEYLEGQPTKTMVVVTFLAVLELIHYGKIRITQEENFGEIVIESLEDENAEAKLLDIAYE